MYGIDEKKIGSTYFNDELVYDGNDLGKCNESAGQGRQKDFGCGISTVTESGRI